MSGLVFSFFEEHLSANTVPRMICAATLAAEASHLSWQSFAR